MDLRGLVLTALIHEALEGVDIESPDFFDSATRELLEENGIDINELIELAMVED